MEIRRHTVTVATAIALLLVITVICVSSCGTPSFAKKTVAQFDQAVEKNMSTYKVPGAIVGVWQDGKGQYLKVFGKADRESGRAVTTTDLFKAASVTETITGTLALELVDQGKLSLDDTLSKFDFASGIPNADKITVRMLLNQTSGLPDPSNDSPEMDALQNSKPHYQFTPEEVRKYGIAMGPLSEPGTQYHYSNWNYYLLGMIVEKIAGKSLSEEMQALFFDKLGMKNTRLDPSAKFLLSRPHSSGYSWDPSKPAGQNPVDATDWNTSWTWAAGSVVTDIYDFKTWIEGVADGTLLTPEMRKIRLRDAAAAGGGSLYGLGFMKTGNIYWHNGTVPGYSTFAGSDPHKGITICVFMNLMPGQEVAGQPQLSEALIATLTARDLLKVLGEKLDNTSSGSGKAGGPTLKSEDTRPPCVAIVVDDTSNLGDIVKWRSELASWQKIDVPITFSVFPWPPLSERLANALYADGYEIMMHVPTDNMPPHTYAGPGQLATGMSEAQVFGTLDADAANVPHLGGFNNHEGGRGCNQLDLMTYEVEWAKSKGLFVVDSASSTQSKVTQACLALGLPRRLREVFIDHQNDPAYIRSAMNHLAAIARKNGTAIGICHWFRPNTPTVVGDMIKTLRAQGIHFAFVKDVTD